MHECCSCGDEVVGTGNYCGPCGRLLIRRVANELGVDHRPEGSVTVEVGVCGVGGVPLGMGAVNGEADHR